MAQSVKLTDGSYVDAEAIYDKTQEKTQSDMNAMVASLNDSIKQGGIEKRYAYIQSGDHLEFFVYPGYVNIFLVGTSDGIQAYFALKTYGIVQHCHIGDNSNHYDVITNNDGNILAFYVKENTSAIEVSHSWWHI